MMDAIEIEKLSVELGGETVLAEINLKIPAGRVIGLLGPSGAGKTTLMRAIVGVQQPASGSVTVLGKPAGSAKLRPLIGYVTQAPAVYTDLTVSENLRYFGAMVGARPPRQATVLSEVSLEPLNRRLVRDLSGGEQARVSLAVALLGKPRLLVLDEPTVGLDPVLRADLWQHFHRLARDGTSLLISSHVMDEANRCDSLILLRDGRVLATGTPELLQKETRSEDIETAFLRLVKARL